jgi:hypothetical protein
MYCYYRISSIGVVVVVVAAVAVVAVVARPWSSPFVHLLHRKQDGMDVNIFQVLRNNLYSVLFLNRGRREARIL